MTIEPVVTQIESMLSEWYLGLLLCVAVLGVGVYRKTAVLPAITFVYLCYSAIRVFADPMGQYTSDPFYYIPICYISELGLICFLLLVGVCLHLGAAGKALVILLLPWVGVFNSIDVIYGWVMGTGRYLQGLGYSGFLEYAGMNGVLISFSLPFLLSWGNSAGVVGALLCLFAIYLSASSIPYGVIIAMLVAYWVHKKQYKLLFLPFVPVLAGIYNEKGIHYIQSFFDSAHRFDAYTTFMGAWWRFGDHWLGNGLGSYQVIEKIIQKNTGFMVGQYWSWMHSDWLQLLWETGWVGLALVAATTVDVIYRLYKQENSAVLALACGLAASAIFDFPVRYFCMAFLCVFVVSIAYGGIDGKKCDSALPLG